MEKNITGAENSMQQGHHSEGEGGGGAIVNRNPSPPLFNCPRCHSDNTKFCYYNNHSLTQSRYFCKTCRRTQGLSTPIRVPNSTAVIPPPLIGGSFYIGRGTFLSTLAALRPLSGARCVAPSSLSGTQVVAPENLGCGGSSAQIGGNISVLRGVSLPSLKSPVAQPSMHFCPPQPPVFSHWSQGFVISGDVIMYSK
ncbi:hypothetical protein ACS0TY_018052 [Phlomoides rotata]